MTWHVSEDQLALWGTGQASEVAAMSVESHLVTCDACRHRSAAVTGVSGLDHRWSDLADRLDQLPRGPFEIWARRLGVSQATVRLLGGTPSLRVPWLVAVTLTVALAGASARARGDGAPWLFVAMAPLVPVLGIALSYARSSDPGEELARTTPYHGLRLLLVRAVAVLSVSLVVTGIGALALPDAGEGIVLSLLPALCLTGITLALQAWLEPWAAASATTLGWAAAVGYLFRRGIDPQILASEAAVGSLMALLVASLLLVAARRDGYDVQRGGPS